MTANDGQSRMKHLTALLLGTLLVGLSACGGSQPEPEATAEAPTAPKAAAPHPDDATTRMARAVGSGKPGAAVDIRYEFKGKPDVGLPTELSVAIIPNVGVDSMHVVISGMEGVSTTGELQGSFPKVEPGKPYMRTVTLLPERNGVYYVTATVTTEIGTSSLGRTFAIPFVVGNVQQAQKPAPAKDAKGEAIESLPAKESGG
jgi:hypothetical protein